MRTAPGLRLVRGSWLTVIAALPATAVLASCGGDDNEGSTEPAAEQTPTETPTATPTPTVDPAAEKRIAQAAQLQLEDFPSGWQEADEEEDSEPSPCEAIRDARDAVSGRASAPTFSEGESTEASSTVYLYEDEATAEQWFAELASRDTRECLAEAFAESASGRAGAAGPGHQPDFEVGEPRTGRVSIDPLGDAREASRLTLPVSAQGFDVDYIIDLVYVRVGRGVAFVVFADVLSPFDENLREDLTGKVVRRLTAELT